ncbi:MAG: CoA transferase [Burkholderiales bacterium]|nr:CoA transferase [Burkholderiales bacterium]
MSGPLAGVRIVDLTTVVMGPFATQLLADLGAEVVKVEPPEGDNTRHLAPMRHAGMGAIFLHMNRNKRSLVLDLKKTAGREALLKLAATADALVYNTRPQAMARLRLSYADVRAVNARIVYAGAFGFDQAGPYAARPAYDDLIQGAVAIPWLMMQSGSDAPRYVPATLCDRIVGQATANALLAALLHRERTGEGQAIEVPMFETMAQFILGDHMTGRSFVPPLGNAGYARVLAPFRAPYATSDGHICVLIYNDRQWPRFLAAIGRPELMDDPRFATHSARARHIDEIYRFVAEQMKLRSTSEWERLLSEIDVPWMRMNSLDSLIDDAHLAHTGFFRRVEHPSEGAMTTMAVPTRFSASPPERFEHAPRFGQHSEQVLREVGYSDAEIAQMIRDGVTVIDASPPCANDDGQRQP